MTFDMKAYNRAYYLANKERLRASIEAWQEANPEKVRAYKRKNEKSHLEERKQYYRDNRERILPNVKAHQERNNALGSMKRRAWAGKVMKEASPPWLTDEQIAAMQWFYDESRRLTKETGIRHDVDHIEPLNDPLSCGLHVPWNLQVLTHSENAKKHWASRRRG